MILDIYGMHDGAEHGVIWLIAIAVVLVVAVSVEVWWYGRNR